MTPKSYLGRLYFGRLLVKTGHAKEGLAELESAREISPSSSQVHFFLASLYQTLGRRADAERERAEFRRLHSEPQRREDAQN